MQEADSIQHDPSVYAKLPFHWAAFSDKGLCREANEDAFLMEPEAGLFLVSDGMGGHRGGQIASEFVCQNLSVYIETGLLKLRSRNRRSIRNMLKRTICNHNKELFYEGQSESGYKDMGATAVLCLLDQGFGYIANLGDSRCYRFRAGKLKQLSNDHSVVNELIEQGRIEPEEAVDHEASGQITQYVGMDQRPDPHVRSFAMEKADRLLLCTDGLTDMMPDAEIATVLGQIESLEEAAVELVKRANEAGGYDNVTVLLIEWRGRGVSTV